MDSNTALDAGGSCGGFKAWGRANKRDLRKRFAVGDSLAVAILFNGRWKAGRRSRKKSWPGRRAKPVRRTTATKDAVACHDGLALYNELHNMCKTVASQSSGKIQMPLQYYLALKISFSLHLSKSTRDTKTFILLFTQQEDNYRLGNYNYFVNSFQGDMPMCQFKGKYCFASKSRYPYIISYFSCSFLACVFS